MLTEILDRKTCADCRMCCIFDRYDIWETPLFDEETRNKVLDFNPDAEFAKVGGKYVLNACELAEGDLFRCPALTENGCFLGNEKPFDCMIYPFRIMEKDGRRVIAVSTLCEAVHGQNHEKLENFLNGGLAEKIFSYADINPETVKPYYDNYTVIMTEKKPD